MELHWRDDAVTALLSGALMEGLEVAAEHLLTVSTQLAPLEEGDLARSGEVSTDRSRLAAAVSYDRPYAVVQHEELSYRHDAGKTAKYLETPMHTERDAMLALIGAAARRAAGG